MKKLADEINLNTTKNVSGESIKTTDIKALTFLKGSDVYKYKITYKTVNWNEVNINDKTRSLRKTATRNDIDIGEISLKPAYASKIPISQRKKQDLLELIQKNIVP